MLSCENNKARCPLESWFSHERKAVSLYQTNNCWNLSKEHTLSSLRLIDRSYLVQWPNFILSKDIFDTHPLID